MLIDQSLSGRNTLARRNSSNKARASIARRRARWRPSLHHHRRCSLPNTLPSRARWPRSATVWRKHPRKRPHTTPRRRAVQPFAGESEWRWCSRSARPHGWVQASRHRHIGRSSSSDSPPEAPRSRIPDEMVRVSGSPASYRKSLVAFCCDGAICLSEHWDLSNRLAKARHHHHRCEVRSSTPGPISEGVHVDDRACRDGQGHCQTQA